MSQDSTRSTTRPGQPATSAADARRDRSPSGIEVEESSEFEQIELSSPRRLSDFHGLDLSPSDFADDEALLPAAEFFAREFVDEAPVGVGDRLVQLERRCMELAALLGEQAARISALKDEHQHLSTLVREKIGLPGREPMLYEDGQEPTIAADPPPPPVASAKSAGIAAASAPHCVLLPLNDPEAEVFELNSARAYVGRGGEADLRIADSTVSRLHAVIRAGEGGLVIEDVGSRNGLFVNDFRVRRAVVNDGDRVTFGTVAYVIRVLPGGIGDRRFAQ